MVVMVYMTWKNKDCNFHRNQTFGRRIDHLLVYFWTSVVQFDTAWVCQYLPWMQYRGLVCMMHTQSFTPIVSYNSFWKLVLLLLLLFFFCLINLVSCEVPAQSSRIPNGVLHYSTYMIWWAWELSIRPEATRDVYDHRQALGPNAQKS